MNREITAKLIDNLLKQYQIYKINSNNNKKIVLMN